MSSLVELVFSAVGVEPTADAVKKVTAAIDENARALARQGVVSEALAQGTAALQRMEDEEYRALRARSAARVEAAAADKRNLETQQALKSAQEDQIRSLLALGAAALSARAVYQGFKEAVGDGAELQQLSLRTGENIRNLVIEEQAFKNAGLGANYLGTAANLLDRALSPVNANAKRNAEVFRELGLSMPQLRTMSFREQLEALSQGFARLPDQSAKAQAAMQLFGRYAGGQMLQLFGDPQALERAEQQTGGLANQMERNAAAFLRLQQDINGVKTQIESIFVATSEQLLPALEKVAHFLGDLSGQSLGTIFGTSGLATAGGLAGMFALPKLEMGLAKAAGVFQSEMLLVASNLSGKLAQFLPIGLAAVVAEQIIFGIIQAWEDSQIQAILNQSRGVHTAVDPFRKASDTATTGEAMQQNLIASQFELARMIQERGALQGRASIRHVNAKTGDSTYTSDLSGDETDRLGVLNLAIPKLAADISNIFGSATVVAKQLILNQAAAFNGNAAALIAQLPALQEKNDKAAFAQMTPEQQLAAIAGQRSGLNAQLAAIPAGASDDAKKATRLSLENQILELQKQQEEAEKKIAEAAKKTADEEQKRQIYALETQREVALAAGDTAQAQTLKEQIEQKRAIYSLSGLDLNLAQQRADAEHKIWETEQARKAAKDGIESEKRALESSLSQIRENLAKLQADYTRTDAEKWADRKVGLQAEIDALVAAAAKERTLAAAARAPGGAGDTVAVLHGNAATGFDQQAARARGDLAKVGADPSNPFEQMISSVTKLRNEWGTTAQQIGGNIKNIIGGAVQSVSQNISGAIAGTETWRQAFGRIGLAIEQSIISALVEVGARMLMNAVLSKVIAADDKKDSKEKTANLALEAGMKSISQLGPLWGTVAFAASLAAIMAMVGGFRELGGPVSAGVPYVVGEKRPEVFVPHSDGYIFPDASSFTYSAPALPSARPSSANAAAARPASSASSSSGGGSGGSRESIRANHFYFDPALFARAIQEHTEDHFHRILAKDLRS
jgi:hypothetical protein